MTTVIKDWLIRRDDGVFDIDCDIIYPRVLALLNEFGKRLVAKGVAILDKSSGPAIMVRAAELDEKKLDQYWLELLYQVTKLEAQRLIFQSDFDTRSQETPALVFHFRTAAKARWKHAGRPLGLGIRQATQGKDARRVFEVLRGAIPR